ncbi:Stk1 family PASTA domain-containing Ser/Thr kinase [Pseudarthrobacter sp. P1]|uniref:Stk1 family PASTA domain-containing Ser/Thr kinase n=1 Tax=Pseudarthrobacter sp. P1 TaxID=3418418 RepID=UPI003CEA6D85
MSIPRVLNGRYELGELLGRGGMADVHMGRDIRLGRTVAVKLLRGDLARDPQLQVRFRREAQAVAGLNHPSIVAVYDTGDHSSEEPLRDGTRQPFIVMEYVRGRTLRDLIRAKEISIDHAIDYTLGVLSALEYSHRAGIVHRDIKPANVMVTQDDADRLGTIKVMDFGIARTIADSTATLTQTQAVIGTAQYLSPEQARGETVDERSDLYSAACLFYEMLAGRPPFVGDSPVSVAYQHVREPPIPASVFNSEVSPALDSVLMRALQKNRTDRFQNAASFRRALRAARTGVELAPVPATGPNAAPRTPAAGIPVTVPAAARAALPATGATTTLGLPEPATRAMAKALSGGALTTDDGTEPVADGPDRAVKVRRRTWMATFFVFLAIVLGGGGVLGYNLLTAEPPVPPKVAIPSVANLSETEAVTALINARFKPQIEPSYDAKVPKGIAIGTDPSSGSMATSESFVRLQISKGPATVAIPSTLANKTESEARGALSALGLVPGDTLAVNDPSIEKNLVVTTDPAPAAVVGVGSKVNLKISSGKVTMPALYSKTQDEATLAIQQASPTLKVEFQEVENPVSSTWGQVTRQSVDAGASVDQGSTITVQIAKAPAAPETPSPSPSPSPTPSPSSDPSPGHRNGGSDNG